MCVGRCDCVSRDITGAGCLWHQLFRLSSVENSRPSLSAVEQSHRLHLVHFQKPKRGAEESRPVWVRGCWCWEVGGRGWGLQPLAGGSSLPSVGDASLRAHRVCQEGLWARLVGKLHCQDPVGSCVLEDS